MALHVVISNRSGTPIYEQIAQQVRAAILGGDVSEGEALPSIRGLARDLQISVITTSRAYADLAQQGFITNVPGKGSFVLPRDTALMREHVLREVEQHLDAAVASARLAHLTVADLHHLLDLALDPQEEP